jgi:hypothetical protein
MKAQEEFIPWEVFEDKLNVLHLLLNSNDVSLIRRTLKDILPGYTPNEKIVDWVYLEQSSDSMKRGLGT